MATQKDVRRIALALPGVVESTGQFAFRVENKGALKLVVWAWRERVHPKKPKVPRDDVVVVRVAGEDDKEALLAGDPEVFFTEPHYDGYPAVLVRLPAIRVAALRKLITDSWRRQAPRALTETAAAGSTGRRRRGRR